MNLTEVLQTGSAIIISLGGAGAIIMALSSWLGKVWAARILEEDKNKYQVALEQLKSQYQLDVEKNKSVFLRYSESQFNLYNSVWVALCDLEKAADQLWAAATRTYVRDFAKSLSEAKHEVRKGALIIEEEHYERLISLFSEFEEFEFGKSKLLQLRRERERIDRLDENEIRWVIDQNGQIRERFKDTLSEVKNQFSSQLRGDYLDSP
ncbi:hypothetical protein [Pseudoalteromonas spongiae]|uniref:hypothetical protein n=1 Tax=Pseudoalteromonas spongiae TaxID=298657 RepID=UPI00110AE7C7|nr:hypothetical protein [Pseudoalteromonas spongiae]TMO83140.1 hypothetical protein CWC15_16955 [Pseudoalteromonas spongiae]